MPLKAAVVRCNMDVNVEVQSMSEFWGFDCDDITEICGDDGVNGCTCLHG